MVEGAAANLRPDLTDFYNMRSPFCEAGIAAERNRLLPLVRSGWVKFREIDHEPYVLWKLGASLEDVRKRLHALKANGRPVVSADVALALWKMGIGRRWLAALLGLPGLRQLTRLGYDLFAEALYRWNLRRGHWTPEPVDSSPE